MDETAEDTKKYEQEGKSVRLTRKLKRVLIKTLTRIKIVMYHSKKTLKKQLTLLKKKKTGLDTLREVPKKQKITWRK